MEIHEFVDEGLGHSSYLVHFDGTALVIDPPRFPAAIEQRATDLGASIAWTADTHSHADYVSGSRALASRTGATFLAPAASHLETSYQPVGEDEVVELTDAYSLRALATPGHTPDHMAYLLCRRSEPVALFSGGSLMVGTVGRTDLCGPDLAEPLAHEMFSSLHRFDDLADELAVYPTHGAGSFCGAPGDGARTTTLGAERSTNPLLRIGDEDQFVEALLAGFGTFPSYFGRLPEINRRGPARYDDLPELARLSPAQVADAAVGGAVVVDARSMDRFGASHIPGSLANTLRPVFASWAGWLVDPDQQLVFVLDADQDRADLVRQCLDVGLENLLGELDGGIDAWAADGRPTAPVIVVDATHMAATVIDVRQANEYTTGHLPDAANIELGSIPDTPLPDDEVTVMCGHGERAMTAASLLAARGHAAVSVFDGGPDTWADATGRDLEIEP
jgi:hydroxyacylglutathione hydrolase